MDDIVSRSVSQKDSHEMIEFGRHSIWRQRGHRSPDSFGVFQVACIPSTSKTQKAVVFRSAPFFIIFSRLRPRVLQL